MRWIKNLSTLGNGEKLAIVTFFQNLYLYNHVGALYQQTRGLSLFQINSLWSIIVGTVFMTEVPTGIIADKIGRKKSVVIALFIQFLGEFFYLFASITNILCLFPVFIFTYAFAEAKNPLISSYQNEQIDSNNRATTISLINMLIQFYVAIMGLVFGKIADYSIPVAFATIGVIVILSTLSLRVDKITLHLKNT